MASQAALDLIIGLQDNASGGIGKITGALGSLGKAAAGLAVGGVLAVGAGLVTAASAGLGFNNSMEQATARINAFTKDATVTAGILDMVRERAARTPFAFEEMANAAAALGPAAKGSGVPLEALIAQAEILAASNPAEGLEGAVFSLKEALSGDFTSIIERFNLPKQRLKELKEQGVPALEAVQIAMKELGLDADLVSGMANTASGRWSTLVDTFTTLAATITAPIFNGVSKGMGDLQVLLDANMPKLQAFATMLGEGMSTAMSWLVDTGIPGLITGWQTLQGAMDTVGSTITSLLDPWDAIVATIINFGLAFGVPIDSILSFIGTIQTLATTISTAIAEAIPVAIGWIQSNFPAALEFAKGVVLGFVSTFYERFQAILAVVQSVLPAVQSIVMTVFGVIAGFIKEHGDSIITTLSGAWNTVQGAITTIITLIGSVIKTVFGVIASFLTENSETIQTVLSTAWTTIQTVIQLATLLITNIIIPAFTAIAGFINSHATEIQAILQTAWDLISTIVLTALNVIQGVVRTVMALIQGDWSGAWTEIKATAETLWNGIKDVIDIAINAAKVIVSTVLETIKGYFTSGWEVVQSAVQTVFSTIGGYISGPIDTAKNAVSTAISVITSAINGAISLINGFIDLVNRIPNVNIPSIGGGTGGGGGSGMNSISTRSPLMLATPSASYGARSTSTTNQYAIHIDARGATNPAEVEAAGYRGAKRAMDESGGLRAELRSQGLRI